MCRGLATQRNIEVQKTTKIVETVNSVKIRNLIIPKQIFKKTIMVTFWNENFWWCPTPKSVNYISERPLTKWWNSYFHLFCSLFSSQSPFLVNSIHLGGTGHSQSQPNEFCSFSFFNWDSFCVFWDPQEVSSQIKNFLELTRISFLFSFSWMGFEWVNIE